MVSWPPRDFLVAASPRWLTLVWGNSGTADARRLGPDLAESTSLDPLLRPPMAIPYMLLDPDDYSSTFMSACSFSQFV
jgi:hypothetical protein